MALFGIGGGGSKQRSQSTTNRDTFLAPFQQGALESLFGQANMLQRGLTPGATRLSENLVLGPGGLLSQGQQLAGGLQNIAAGRFGQGLAQTIGQLQGFPGAGGSAAAGMGGLGPSQVGQLNLTGQLAGTGALQGLAGSAPLSQSLLQQNPALQGSLDVLGQNIQQNLRASLGQIAGQAGLAGARGGARQALAAGEAAGDAARAFAGGAGSLISQDFAARQALAPELLRADQAAQLSAAQQLQQGDLARRGLGLEQARLVDQLGVQGQQLGLEQAGLIDQAAQVGAGQQLEALTQAGGLGLGAADLQRQAGIGGLEALGNLFNLGMAPFSAAFQPALNAAQIIGSPIILEQLRQQSTGKSNASNISFGFG